MDDLGKDMAPAAENDDFSLDDILREFSDENLAVESEPAQDDSRPVRLDEDGKVVTAEINSREAPPVAEASVTERVPASAPAAPEKPAKPVTDYDIVSSYKPVDQGDLDVLLKDVELNFVTDSGVAPADYAEEEAEEDEPAEEKPYAPPEPESEEPPEKPRPERPFGQRAAAPFVALMAMISMKRQQRQSTVKAAPPEEAEDLGPEMDADRASRYYGSHIKFLRARVRVAAVISLVLMYISLGLPVFGRLNDPAVGALMCLIGELAVVIVCLDVFTAGIVDLFRKKAGAGSLIAVSCVISALDAVITAAAGKDTGLPFCAVSALSITCALWASLLQCKGNRISLRTLALTREPFAVTAETGVADGDITLIKTKTGTENFVRRVEEITPDEEAYSTLAPWLMIAALVLSLIAAIISRSFSSFVHILAAIFMPAAPLTALLAFPLPYSIVSRKIFHSGSAIAGWSGLCDIGGSKRIVITDRDIFPANTVSITSVRILEGMSPQKIISYAGSVIAASGSGLAPVFTELMDKNGCALESVGEFCCHEGGGLTAMINGEEVLCGNSGFMHLMGVRLPQKLASKSSVFVSVNGMISAIFTINYTPVVTVQKALALLLRTRRQAVFAIRDFNVTPEMIRHKFKLPTDGFDFPSFARRYDISAAVRADDSKIAAVISREGLGALVELSDEGHRLFTTVRLSVLMSLLCTVIGMIMMFLLCATGAFDSASVGNMLLYQLLWLLPELALVFGLRR